MSQLEMSRLHETHFGSSVNSIPCTVVHSPIEVSSLSPEQLRLTPISTIDRGRTGTGHERGRRSVLGEDDGVCGRPDGRHIPIEGGVRHIQLATTRLFPLGPAAPIDRMPHVQFRSNPQLSSFKRSVGPPSNVHFPGRMGQYLTASWDALYLSRNTRRGGARRVSPLWRRRKSELSSWFVKICQELHVGEHLWSDKVRNSCASQIHAVRELCVVRKYLQRQLINVLGENQYLIYASFWRLHLVSFHSSILYEEHSNFTLSV